ncbi:MAG: hypothetical protein DIJKHBIC_00289 [Thermoanaerobaculia bacterium]|nr:hypothetical protein [Thermoanaerobaculia bacterium]
MRPLASPLGRFPAVFAALAVLVGSPLLPLPAAGAPPSALPPKSTGGTRRAVITGINDYGYIKKLKGCVADAHHMRDALVSKFGFDPANVRLLLDKDASRTDILQALRSSVAASGPGDLFVFYYSGHGSVFPDDLSPIQDETRVIQAGPYIPRTGRYDSALCSWDTGGPSTNPKPWENLILDDELNEIFAGASERGVAVTLISDSCHSGSLARELPRDTAIKFVSPREALRGSLAPAPRSAGPTTPRAPGKGFIALGGCKDEQTSKDSPNGGLFTTALLAVVEDLSHKNKGALTYETVFAQTKGIVMELSRKIFGELQEPSLDDRFFGASLSTPLFTAPGSPSPPVPATAPPAPVPTSIPASPPATVPPATPPTPASVPAATAAAPVIRRVVIRIRDHAGNPVAGAAIALLPASFPAGKEIRPSDALALGRTGEKGLYDSGAVSLSPGLYRARIVAPGLRTFDGPVTLEGGIEAATAVLSFDLDKD